MIGHRQLQLSSRRFPLIAMTISRTHTWGWATIINRGLTQHSVNSSRSWEIRVALSTPKLNRNTGSDGVNGERAKPGARWPVGKKSATWIHNKPLRVAIRSLRSHYSTVLRSSNPSVFHLGKSADVLP